MVRVCAPEFVPDRVMVCSEGVGEGEGVDVVLVRIALGEHKLVGSDKVEAARPETP
jgi:hypothetical protein